MKFRQLYIIWGLLLWVWQGGAQSSGNNKLYIPEMQAVAGSTALIPVHLDNSDDVVAFQFDLEFPDRVSPVLDGKGRLAVNLSERMASDAIGTYNRLSSNKYRLLVFSSSNRMIGGSKGEILSFQAKIEDIESLIETKVPFTITNIVLTKKDAGKVNCTVGENRVEIVRGNRPDLEVSVVKPAATAVKPGGSVGVSWLVRNIGNQPTKAGWKESVYLVGQDGKSEFYLGNLNYGDVLSANGQVSRNAEFRLGEYPGLDGDVQVKVKLTPNADAGELEADATNNVSVSGQKLNLQKVLTFRVSKNSVAETAQSGVYCYVYRSGDRSSEESFKVENSNTKRLNAPAEVRIPEGQSGASFIVVPIDDSQANPDSTAVITIQGGGYGKVEQVIRIEDDEQPFLKLSMADNLEVSEGGTFTLTLEREWDIPWPLTVKLSSDHPKRFENFPSEVVIPGHARTKEVTIKVKDDDLPGLDDEVVFTASAPGHAFDLTSKRFVTIKDNDIPDITLELSTSTVGEANQVVKAILKRSGITNNKVTVNLTDDGNGRISMPSSVILEAGVAEKEFAIRTVDNEMKDGDKVVKITGVIYLSSCNCSTAGTKAGVFEKTLTVVDDDNVALKIESSKATLLEGETGQITISVNQVLSAPLTVHLSSENSRDVQFPAFVMIPVGQKSVDVDVTANRNSASEGNRVTVIVIDAGTFGKSICWLNITDQNLPDAVVTAIRTEEKIPVSSSAKVSVTVKNEGAASLPAQTKVAVYLSTGKDLNSSSIVLGNLYTQKDLAVGESVTLDKNFIFPEKTGDYNLIAIINEEQTKKELSYINNSSAPLALTLTPLYTVQVSLDKSVLKTGESVMVTGQVSGSKTAGVPIDLYIINDGYRQVLNVNTDNAGIFQKKFTPEGWQMGHFSVGACYPGESLDKEMAGFDLYGLKKVSNSTITWEVFTNEKTTGSIKLSNLGNKVLSNVAAKIISQPKNCTIRFSSIGNLIANGTAELQYEVMGTAVSPGVDWEPVKVQVASTEGVVLDLDIYYYCRSQAAQLEVSEANLNTTMTIGAIREYPVTITNTGKGETGEINVVLPNTDWMSLVSPVKMPSLKYGESTTVLLQFAPGGGMEANVAHKGQFVINCANGNGVPVSFRITPVSSEKGTLVVDVCDEYTYYTAEKPHVSGAKVRVTRPNTNEVLAEGTTGADGLFTRELTAGYYTLEVTADKHDLYKNTILVDPGMENKKVIDLSYRAITYSWEVEETTVEDEYEIRTDVKYETNVPVPVVVTEMPEYVPADKLAFGESYVFEVKLTNKGLITANDVLVVFPQNLKSLEFELLFEDNFDLKAQQSVIIPVKMTRKGGLTKAVNNENSDLQCFIKEVTIYRWKCNEEHKWVKVEKGTRTRKVCLKKTNTGGDNDYSSYPIGMDEDELYDYILKRNKFFADAFTPSYTMTEVIAGGIEHFMCNPTWRCLRDIAFLAAEFIPGSDCPRTLASCGASALASASDQYLDDQFSASDNVKTAGGCLIGFVSDCLVPFVPGVGQIGKAVELTAKAVNIASSAQSAINSCKNLLSQKQTKSSISIIDDFANVNEIAIKESKAILAISEEVLGIEGAYEFMSSDLRKIRQYFLESDLENWSEKNLDLMALCPDYMLIDDYVLFIQRIKNTYDYYTTGKCKGGDNYINHIKLSEYLKALDEVEEIANHSGYQSFGQMYREKEKLIVEYLKESSSSVCSSVGLQFSQSMVMTRQAFLGTLTINNSHESETLNNIRLNLSVTNEDNVVATNHEFQINIKNINNLTFNADGSWNLACQESGFVIIEFIPTKYAAQNELEEYTFGGTLSYLDPFTGLEVTRDLFPVTMTVKPSPNLEMDYFMQRDILGDDPLTKDVVEPMVPSEFSLLIHNVGAGDATNVRMTTKQPKITDNEKGLLVDFQIKTSQLNGEEETAVMGESVATDFGTIEAGRTVYAQWWLTSTLLGHFTDYKVEATHVTSYDNSDLSLLDTVRIHELIRGIRVNESATPKVTGFMVNDIPDAEDFPDMMYLTDGTIAPVVKAKDAKLTGSGSDRTLTVTPSTVGWNYINIEDPTKGSMKLVSINGDTNLDTRKVWQTDRTLRDGKDPKYEYRIHVVDYFDNIITKATGSTPGEFRLVFEERPEKLLAVESILGLPEGDNIATTPVEAVTIKFNKSISANSLTAEMFSLFCQGKKMDTKGLQFKQQEGISYLLDLSALTKQSGVYTLTIHTSDIKDADGFTGGEDYSVVWNQLAGGKVFLTALADPEKAGTVTPASIQVDYGKDTEFKAKANKGYLFKNWTINGRAVSTEETYSHTAIVDQRLVANFDPISYKIEISYNAAQGFVSFGTGYYEYDSSLELIATPDDGYRFVGWFIAGNLVSSKELFVYRVSGDAKLEARFQSLNGSTDPDDPNNSDDPDNPTANENMETLVIQVYPTKVTDYVHVGELPVKSRLILFNLAGKQVKQVASCEGDIDLFMGDQPSGVYFLYILAGEERRQTVKLIKK